MPTLLTGCDSPKEDSGAATPAKCTTAECAKLVRITVVRNATQTNVTGGKNWATVKKATDDIVVEATTEPNTEDAWKAINWSGDSGSPGDKANQRKLSRAVSKKLHLEAELGGIKDDLDVWVLWASITIMTSGQVPANSAKFGGDADGTENLGAVVYDSIFSREDGTHYQSASGKVALYAVITPKGVGKIIPSGWSLKRERWGHDWADGKKRNPGNTHSSFWNTDWVDDTSVPANLRLTPDADDKLYDIDGPNIRPGLGQTKTYETYNNFRQWIEWNSETCSVKAEWYFRARWQETAKPNVTLKDLGLSNKALPDAPL